MMNIFGLGLRSPIGSSKGKPEAPSPGTPWASPMTPRQPRPMKLVYCDDKGKFRMDPEAALILHRIKGPLGVVSVCGRARQGKSFILNQGTYSTQIFSLAVLLSSMFVYNQMGGIDEAALDRLSLVTEMTNHIRVRASEGQTTVEDIGRYSPCFLWLLRDFYLDLNEEGQRITPREYLEIALKPMQGSNKDVAAKNKIRESIRALFPDRECFTLVRPLNNERDLQRLDQTCVEKLRPEFRVGLNALTNFIFERAKPKQVGSTVMTGPIFAGLTQSFLDAINAGAVPTIATSWQSIEERECRRAYDSSIQAYIDAFDKSKSLEEEYMENAFKEAEIKCSSAIQTMDGKLRASCNIPGATLEQVLEVLTCSLTEYDRSAYGPRKWRRLATLLVQTLEGPILDLTNRMEHKSAAQKASLELKCRSVEDKLALLAKQLEASQRNESDYLKRYEDAVSDKKNISDEYASRLASIQGKYSSLEERYGNLSHLLEVTKEESFEWKRKYDQLAAKQKLEEEQMGAEIASVKTRCSSAEARLSAAREQVESAKEEATEWRRKHDLAIKDAQTAVECITTAKERAMEQAQLREDTLRAEFSATIAEKENKVEDSIH